ncbi:recombinase family protein [Methylobacterium sp. Leaf89]|uniref:recombinase family protein n=1 Tax=Methylobacterium sp. Leaf89 TaxID=1736245 RepID=UPI0009EA5EFF|nr:recombinase family protein [Methylobacterium sp. Leaf89]
MPTAYSYIRMSTDQQIRGDSLRRQLEFSRQWAEQHGVVLDESLRDIGVSAWKGKNRKEGALGRFLEMVNTGEVRRGSYLLVESLDRLSRDQVLEALGLFLEVIRSGITIVTLADNQSYSQESVGNDWSKLIISLTIMARAHEESQRKSERVSQSYVARVAAAKDGRGLSILTPSWITATKRGRGDYLFELNEHAETVRRIFELTADGLGQMAIAQRFNQDGTPTLTPAKGWYNSSVSNILNSRVALGEFQPHRMEGRTRLPAGDPIPDYFPAAVDATLFTRAQARRFKRPFIGGRKGTLFSNIFSGLCLCQRCGGSMVMSTGSKSQGAKQHLRCLSNMRKKGCTNATRFAYADLEPAVLDKVREFQLSDVMRSRRGDDPLKQIDEDIAQARLSIEKLDRLVRNLMQELEEEDDPAFRKAAREKAKARLAERNEQQERLEDLEHSRNKVQAELSEGTRIEDEIEQLRAEWEQADQPTRYQLRAKVNSALRDFIDFINFDGDTQVVTIIVLGGLRAYRFQTGEFLASVDLLPHVGSRSEGGIDPSMFTTDGITAEGDNARRAALNKLLSRA